MWKIPKICPRIYFGLLFFPFCLWSKPATLQELEVRLETRSQAKPVYLSRLYADSSESDWRYLEELRSSLETDLNQSGFCTLVPKKEELENSFHFPDVRSDFNVEIWKKERIAYAISIQVFQGRFTAIAFNPEKGTSKKYPDISLSRNIEEDRRKIHRFYDGLQKDLFGIEGIASLRILYTQRVKNEEKGLDWISEVWICDADGCRARQLTHDKSYCLSPSFFPKSSPQEDLDFFYVSEKNGQSKIYRSSLSHSSSTPLVDLRGNQALPSLTQKGNQMAFITDVAGRPDLFIQNFDPKGKCLGKARQLYSCSRATQASPTYSPDGSQIAFVSDKDGPPRIYVLNVSGPKETLRPTPRILTKKNRENTSPAWSPDGTKLAYSSKVDGVRQIWVYDFATEEERQLTTGPETKENPAWAPDSFHLIYNTESNDLSELYLIHLNQGEPFQITKGFGQKRFASWEPR